MDGEKEVRRITLFLLFLTFPHPQIVLSWEWVPFPSAVHYYAIKKDFHPPDCGTRSGNLKPVFFIPQYCLISLSPFPHSPSRFLFFFIFEPFYFNHILFPVVFWIVSRAYSLVRVLEGSYRHLDENPSSIRTDKETGMKPNW